MGASILYCYACCLRDDRTRPIEGYHSMTNVEGWARGSFPVVSRTMRAPGSHVNHCVPILLVRLSALPIMRVAIVWCRLLPVDVGYCTTVLCTGSGRPDSWKDSATYRIEPSNLRYITVTSNECVTEYILVYTNSELSNTCMCYFNQDARVQPPIETYCTPIVVGDWKVGSYLPSEIYSHVTEQEKGVGCHGAGKLVYA